ncbi:MAG: PDZ domain-containing protein [Clostridia bacterium]|nr:PDZ domain-containing protein [Clostridia bacterium]
MNRKISLGLCLSLVIITVAATFAVTMVFSKQIYNRIISNISQRSQSYSNVEEINRIISNNFYGDLSAFNSNLSASLGEGYVNGLQDKNSYYMTASEYMDYNRRLNGEITGVGIETLYDYAAGELVVTYVYEGSSAESEGLRAVDVITAVDDVAVNRSNYDALAAFFTGSRLDSVRIEYMRDDVTKVAQPISNFSIPTVTGRNVNGVGYVRISSFGKNTAAELKSVLEDYKKSGLTAVIIDLRNNREGTIKYAANALDVIISNINGSIAIARHSNGKEDVFTAENSNFTQFAYAVLINGGTSGPAELFACDMRDILQCALIGTTTAGVGTMQEVFTLDDGGAIMLTTALIIPRAGENAVYDGVGIAPDANGEITLPVEDANISLLDEANDNQLNAAVNLLTEQMN